MKIIVEIGTEEQKELIRSELSVFSTLTQILENPPNINQIIVPTDFDQKVQELVGNSNYQSERGHLAIAKIIPSAEGISIVISPINYTESFDYLIRLKGYLHEFFHTITRSRFPFVDQCSPAEWRYIDILTTLYDEYYVERKAIEIVESSPIPKGHQFKKNTYAGLKGHIKTVSDLRYYERIKGEIQRFRFHGDLLEFHTKTSDCIDEVLKSTVYSLALIDSYKPLAVLEVLIRNSHFYTEGTCAFVSLIRQKYDENDFDFIENIDIAQELLLNFGLFFEDTPRGLYVHVFDI